MPYAIYVIELDPAVRQLDKFRRANPGASPLKPCLYVGSTIRKPEERFDQHMRGYKANRYVKKYGQRLRPDLFEKYNPIPKRADAEELEAYLTERLRANGCWVWSN